jgi:hypothetical protein
VKTESSAAAKPPEVKTESSAAAKPPETATVEPPVATIKEGPAASVTQVKAPVAGTLAWVANNGAVVAADAPIAKYQGYVRQEQKLQEGTDRGTFYAKRLADAQAKTPPDPAAIDAFQKKVDEKKQMVVEATAELEKLVVKAGAAGTVKMKASIDDVKAGDVLAEISAGDAGKPTLEATFDAGAAASAYKEGASCIVASKGARDKQFACVVSNVAGSNVTVHVVNVAGSAAAVSGDEVVLLPQK